MNIFQTIGMSLKSIMSNKVRSLLTMLGVIIGVASVITLVSLMTGYIDVQMSSWYSFGVNQIDAYYWGDTSGFQESFDKFAREELDEYIDVVSPNLRTNTSTYYSDKVLSYSNITYSDSSYIDLANIKIAKGRNIAPGDVSNRTKVCVIGDFVRQQFFGGISNPVGEKITIASSEYTIVGILEQKYNGEEWSDDNMIILPHSTIIFNKNENSNGVRSFKLRAKDGDSTKKAIEVIQAEFSSHFSDGDKIDAYTDNSWLEQQAEQQRIITMLVGGIGGISLIVGGIGIMNIMLVSVTERTREIGIRMAIGAKRKNIIGQFLIEAAAVSGFGGIIGILFGSFATVVIGSFITKQIIYPTPSIVIGSFLFSVLLGIIFGLYPANKASKLNPIDALRTQ